MHTPLPWVIGYGYADYIAIEAVTKEDFECIAIIELDEHGAKPTPEQEANAEFMVRACNSHTDMLEALEGIRDLAHTGSAPMAFNMTPRDWDTHKINKIAGEAHQAIEKAKE